MIDKTADMLAEDCQSNYACQFHHSGFCGYCSAKLKKAAQKINRQGIEIADHKKWDDLQAQQIEDLTREVARLKRWEVVPCDNCFQYYQHGNPSPWECPKCKTKWTVRDKEWHRERVSGGEAEEI